MKVQIKKNTDIRLERRSKPNTDCNRFIIAAPWAQKDTNLGTLLRTCDALNACIGYPARRSNTIKKGNTLGSDKVCSHAISTPPVPWLQDRKNEGYRIIGVELAFGAIDLTELKPSKRPTVVLLGAEGHGIPEGSLDLCDQVVEIKMAGLGNSLNVIVAGSLVGYKLRNWV